MISNLRSERLVNALEIIRAYTETYSTVSYMLGLFNGNRTEADIDEFSANTMLRTLNQLKEECEKADLPVTLDAIKTLHLIFSDRDNLSY